MRSTCRLFVAAILLTAAAGVALAQDANAAPPPPAPPVVKPVAELPPIPFANPQTSAVEPALATGQTAPTGEPLPSVAVAPLVPATEKPVTTTGKRVTKQSAGRPAENSSVQMSESFKTAAPVAGPLAVDAAASMPPSDAPAKTAPPETIAPPPPAAKPAAVESHSEVTTSRRTMGVGGWALFGIVIAGLFLAITAVRRRRAQTQRSPSIVDFTTAPPDLAPVLLPRR